MFKPNLNLTIDKSEGRARKLRNGAIGFHRMLGGPARTTLLDECYQGGEIQADGNRKAYDAHVGVGQHRSGLEGA